MKLASKIVCTLVGLVSVVDVFADTAATPTTQEGLISMLPMMAGILLLFYFMIFRPQQKRQSEARKLMDSLDSGDEVITAGGIVGRIVKISDDFIRIALAENIEISLQRASIVKILPKGTMKTLA